jgi:hypothetical protein
MRRAFLLLAFAAITDASPAVNAASKPVASSNAAPAKAAAAAAAAVPNAPAAKATPR